MAYTPNKPIVPAEGSKMIYGQGEMETTEAGANRESNEGRGRFDLLPYEAMEALAKWYEEGAKKYGDRNWEKGLSVKDCINRMIRHAIKAGNGWTDEDHLSAVMWNAAAAITMIKRHPELDDHIWKTEDITKDDPVKKDEHTNCPYSQLMSEEERKYLGTMYECKCKFTDGFCIYHAPDLSRCDLITKKEKLIYPGKD